MLFAHKNGIKIQEEMQNMRDNLEKVPYIEVVGFGKCGIEKIANKITFEVLESEIANSENVIEFLKLIKK